jgi:type III secretion protein U
VSEKTEQPTPQKLRQARKDGKVAHSRMLTAAAASAGGLLGLLAMAPHGAVRLQAWTAALFLRQTQSASEAVVEGLLVFAWLAGPVMAGAALGALACASATAGLQFNPALLSPKWERLSPVAGFKRVFGARQWFDTLKNLGVACVLAAVLWASVQDAGAQAFRAVWLEGSGNMLAILTLLQPAVIRVGAVVLVLGGLDLLLARRRHLKDLMMTREEVKQEYKNSEGDPHHKAKRKAEHQALATSGPARGVHKATAVVVNPTHIAVALRYEPSECEAPYIVALGREQDAFAIRREAKRLGIPVVKDIPLARTLIHYELGEEIPEELYRAAAAVLKVAMDDPAVDGRPRSQTP